MNPNSPSSQYIVKHGFTLKKDEMPITLYYSSISDDDKLQHNRPTPVYCLVYSVSPLNLFSCYTR